MKPSLQQKIDKLSITKLEILCKLNFNGNEEGNEEAKQEQNEIVAYLANLYEFGGKRASPDKLKAIKYKEQLKGFASSPPSMLKGPNSLYTASSWFNFIRLYALRVLMVTEYFVKQTLIPRLYGIGGLLYIGDFLFDAFDILQATVRPAATEEEKNMGFWELRAQRFKNAINEEGRLAHMSNAFVWGIINSLTFFLTGGYTVFITLGGFGFDGIAELFKGGKDYHDHKSLLNEYCKDLKEKRAELENLKRTDNTSNQDEAQRQEKIHELEKEVKKLETYKTQLTNELDSVKKIRTYTTISTFITLAGIAMMFFPPTIVPGVVLTITGLALNLGEKMWEAYKFFKPDNAVPVPAKAINKEPNVLEEATNDVKPGNSYRNDLGILFGRNNAPEVQPLLRDTETVAATVMNSTSGLAVTNSSNSKNKPEIISSPKEELLHIPDIYSETIDGKGLQAQSVFSHTPTPRPPANDVKPSLDISPAKPVTVYT